MKGFSIDHTWGHHVSRDNDVPASMKKCVEWSLEAIGDLILLSDGGQVVVNLSLTQHMELGGVLVKRKICIIKQVEKAKEAMRDHILEVWTSHYGTK